MYAYIRLSIATNDILENVEGSLRYTYDAFCLSVCALSPLPRSIDSGRKQLLTRSAAIHILSGTRVSFPTTLVQVFTDGRVRLSILFVVAMIRK